MNRYEQRRQKLLQNEEVAAGYREMAAELELMRAIDDVRKQLDMSQEQLASSLRFQANKHHPEPKHPQGKEKDSRGRE